MPRSSRSRSGRTLVVLVSAFILGAVPVLGAASGGQPGLGAQPPSDVVGAAAYNLVSADEAALRVIVPVFRSGHTSWRLVTGVAATNVGPNRAFVSLTARDYAGNVTAGLPGMTVSLEPMATAFFWPPDFLTQGSWADPGRAYGSAVIDSNQPLLVAVHDLSVVDIPDAVMFRGASARSAASSSSAVVPMLRSGSSEGPRQGGQSGVLATNTDEVRPAAITMTVWPYGSGRSTSVPAPGTDPEESAVFYLPAIGQAPYGSYSAVVRSDRAISLLDRTDWNDDGAAASHDGVAPSNQVVVPVVFIEHEGRCSSLAIQNADEVAVATVSVELVTLGDPSRTYQLPEFELGKLRGRQVSLCDDPDLARVPRPFAGAAYVTTSTAPLAVTTNVTWSGSKAEAGFEGTGLVHARPRLHAPLVQSAFAATRDVIRSSSTILIHNPGPGTRQARVEYGGAHGTCDGSGYFGGLYDLDARDSVVVPASDGDGGPLPPGCLASAEVTSDGGLIAAVMDVSYESPAMPTVSPTTLATATATQIGPATATATPTTTSTDEPTSTPTASSAYMPLCLKSYPAE